MNDSKPGAANLEPILVLALWVLLFTGQEPKKSELKPQLSPKRRQVLMDRGLIELEKRTSRSRTGRNVSAEHIVLTDEAWRWAAENLDAEFALTANAAHALAGLLPRLKRYMSASGATLVDILSSPDAPGGRNIEDLVRRAYQAASGGQWSVRVRLADLRRRLAGIPREAQDEALLRMQDESKLVLYPNNDPRDITREDEAAAVEVLGAKRHLIYMGG